MSGVWQRVLLALAVLGVLIALVVAVGAGDDSSGDYRVRAIFDNAAFAIPGEDVMVAGAKVGVVDQLEVTDDRRAAVILKIDEPGFKDFRSDAECQIRLQSVIGEKLVECVPTQPRAASNALMLFGNGVTSQLFCTNRHLSELHPESDLPFPPEERLARLSERFS